MKDTGFSPPDPAGEGPVPSVLSRGYTARTWLVITAALDGLATLIGVHRAWLLYRIEADAYVGGEGQMNDLLYSWMGILQTCVYAATAIFFLRWFWSCYSWLRGKDRGRFASHQAIWSWFVPILGFFRPKQIANDIWNGTPVPEGEQGRANFALLDSWWAAWIIQGVVGSRAAGLALRPGGEETATLEVWVAVLADVTSLIAALLAAQVVTATQWRVQYTLRPSTVHDVEGVEPVQG